MVGFAMPLPIPGAVRRDPEHVGHGSSSLNWNRSVAVYSRARPRGELGIAAGGRVTDCKWRDQAMKWVTRERPKIDRIACPWLVARFIDRQPEFLYVPSDQVLEVAHETGAIPYDVPDVELSHVGELCSFDAFLRKYELDEPELQELALIVRGADTGQLDLAPQAAGAARALARPVRAVQGRPRDAAPRHGRVRRALRLAQGSPGRDPRLAAPGPGGVPARMRRSTRLPRRASRRAIRPRSRRCPAPAGRSAPEADVGRAPVPHMALTVATMLTRTRTRSGSARRAHHASRDCSPFP